MTMSKRGQSHGNLVLAYLEGNKRGYGKGLTEAVFWSVDARTGVASALHVVSQFCCSTGQFPTLAMPWCQVSFGRAVI